MGLTRAARASYGHTSAGATTRHAGVAGYVLWAKHWAAARALRAL